MSHKANDIWLEDARDHFREAIDKKEWNMAKAVIADVHEKGFTSESTSMEKELRGEMDKGPSFAHGYVLGLLVRKNEEYKAKGLVPTLDLLIEDLTN